MQPKVEEQREETPEEEQARVFAKLKGMSGGDDKHDDEDGGADTAVDKE
jgi:hypothetical protein